jgi:GNAT superfamily N-acetyltransferase
MYSFPRLVLPAEEYEGFTYPRYRQFLAGAPQVVAVGASRWNEAVGLGLGRVWEDRGVGSILSITVAPNHRLKGIGTTLLARLEEELKKECGCAEAVYMGNIPSAEAVKRILDKRGWGPVRPRMMVCRSNLELILKAPWMHRSYLPPDFEIFPWIQLQQEERQKIREQRDFRYEVCFSPFIEDEEIEPVSSLGLRYRGDVVGWLITHVIPPDTLRFTRMFVRPDLQKRGRAISLLIESMARYKDGPIASVAPNGIFDIHVENRSMIEFAKRRLAPYMTDMYFSYGSVKMFQAASAG